MEAPSAGAHRVSLEGLDPAAMAALGALPARELSRVLEVFTGEGDLRPGQPAIWGTHALDEKGLHFRPRFPFLPGVRYTARVTWPGLRLTRTFTVTADADAVPPRVTAVHPSGDTLPENALRLYVQFSRPMWARAVHGHVHLLAADGREVQDAFVEVQDGLWDAAQTRLTLFLHPGRIKRGVGPGERLGPPLRSGEAYRLVIDGDVADAAGTPMGADFTRAFVATAADRASPSADAVRVERPRSSEAALAVVWPEPLDPALQQRWVWVEDAQGTALSGTRAVAPDLTRWTFTPDRPWSPGRYAVRFQAALEDLAGNRFDRLFDREGPAVAGGGETLAIGFEVPVTDPGGAE